MKTIKFNNRENRRDFISVDKTRAISAEGELFTIGDVVETDKKIDGVATIKKFSLGKKSNDVKAHTDKGWARICFITKVKQESI